VRQRVAGDDAALGARPYASEAAPDAQIAFRGRAAAPADLRAKNVVEEEPKDAKADADAEGNEIFTALALEQASIEVHPMSGRLLDVARLLLDREVFVAGERYRQGLVVDVPALFRHLDQTVLGGSELAEFVARSFFTSDSPPAAGSTGDEFRFRHRFAEPFDALGVQLELTPLPDVGGSAYLTAIAVLLLLSGTGGLFALYRMVAVTVRFAERRNNFVAAVSHELKTPLTAIRMYGEMLRDGMVEDADKRQEYYATITAESERLTRLINNVLEFSRLEQGTREASLVVGSVGPVVREAAAILEPHARDLGFRVEVAVDDDLPPVRFERDAVLQVVVNLVDNALKYAREAGDRVIAIRCSRDGETVCVAVRDRGPGVPAPHLSKIFEPFYRGEDELTRTAKGTGIGLALVRGLAETMDAAVSGRNLSDGGFEVSLRFRPAGG
jgi:signal transduction histidine kinase